MGRAIVKPVAQLIDRNRVADNKHLDIAAAEIDRLTAQSQGQGNTSCAVAKEHALHAAFHGEQAGARHGCSVVTGSFAGFTHLECAQRL